MTTLQRLAIPIAIVLGLALLDLSNLRKPSEVKTSVAFLIPPSNLKYFTLGYDEIIADLMWLRVIQDFDTCGHALNSNSSPIVDNVIDGEAKTRVGRCEQSWSFHLIDSITELAPRFREPYSSGSVILSVAVDDISGAAKIFEKAVERFPNDWQIEYRAAYHYLYELGDRKRAADLLLRAKKNGGPFWLDILAARLYSKSGVPELGKAVLEEFIAKNPEQANTPHVKQRMAEIERELAQQATEQTKQAH